MDDVRIKKTRLSSVVVEHMTEKIRLGEWTPGMQLPAERKLTAEFGVSRTVIREALKILSDRGLIKTENGIHVVRHVTFDTILAQIMQKFMPSRKTVSELMEIRMLLEDYSVKQAVVNADDDAIERMQTAIDKMQDMLSKGRISYEQETAFHMELMHTANNGVLKSIYALCGDLLNSPGKTSLWAANTAGKDITAVREHQAILDAIKQRDEARARTAMRAHIEYAFENLLAAHEQ